MYQELVEKRRWVSNERFLNALNYCMLLPVLIHPFEFRQSLPPILPLSKLGGDLMTAESFKQRIAATRIPDSVMFYFHLLGSTITVVLVGLLVCKKDIIREYKESKRVSVKK